MTERRTLERLQLLAGIVVAISVLSRLPIFVLALDVWADHTVLIAVLLCAAVAGIAGGIYAIRRIGRRLALPEIPRAIAK
jgi:hypothetical protein